MGIVHRGWECLHLDERERHHCGARRRAEIDRNSWPGLRLKAKGWNGKTEFDDTTDPALSKAKDAQYCTA
jgi:hypothetical protein